MSSETRVLLIGPRGSGKSAVGFRLAVRLGLPFLDADEEVERVTGQTIAELFAEGRFREVEREILGGLLAGPPAVLAAGGGAVLWDELAERAHRWTAIWLDAAVETLAARVRGDGGRVRPSLTGRPADEEIGEVVRTRAHLYEALARHRIDTTDLDVDGVASRIEKLLKSGPQTRKPQAD